MYKNIGKTLKTLAIILVIIGCIELIDNFMSFDGDMTLWELFDLGAWLIIASFPLYGFGQMIESTMSIERSLGELLKNQSSQLMEVSRIDQEKTGVDERDITNLSTTDQDENTKDGTELTEKDKKFMYISGIIILVCLVLAFLSRYR